MIVNIFTLPLPYAIQTQADYTIAVESAALFLKKKNHPVDLIVGDFDSSDLAEIKKQFPGTPLQVYDSEKDETDSLLAVREALKKKPETIYLYTKGGARIDHMVANLRLLLKGPIVLINDYVKAYCLSPGTHEIHSKHPYISFFAASQVEGLNVSGFKYTLNDATLSYPDIIGISNEGFGTVQFKRGQLLVIESRDA